MSRKTVTAHRAIYRCLIGEPPTGYHLHHLCEEKLCVNPDHLRPLTPAQHMNATPQAMVHYFKGRTHCKNGHHLEGNNLYPAPFRRCATCARDWANRENAKKREARPPKTRATHCKHGHEWTEANTRWYRGKRFCRVCHNLVTKAEFAKTTKRVIEAVAKGELPIEAAPILRKTTNYCQRGHLLGTRERDGKRQCMVCVALNGRLRYFRKRGDAAKVADLESALSVRTIPKPAA